MTDKPTPTEPRLYIGVDPGLSGALALVDHDGLLLVVHDMPAVDGRVTGALLADWLPNPQPLGQWKGKVEAVGIELVASMPGQGVASMFKFGAAWGVAHGAFGGTGKHRIIDVRPQDWKKRYKITGPKKAQKAKALRLAIERWPHLADRFARKKDDGRAEAALIADHVRQLVASERGE